MEVFVLMGEVEYEGDSLVGVYSSFEEALNAHGVYTRERLHGYDHYVVVRTVLGAPADYYYDDRVYI